MFSFSIINITEYLNKILKKNYRIDLFRNNFPIKKP